MSFELEATLTNEFAVDEELCQYDDNSDNVFPNALWTVAALPGGRLITGCGDERFDRDYTLKVWDKKQGCIQTTIAHERYITSLAVFSDGRVVSASEDGTVKLWDLTQVHRRRCVRTFKETSQVVTCVGVRMDSGVVTGGYVWQPVEENDDVVATGILNQWNPNDGSLMHSLTDHERAITCLETLLDGRVVCGYGDPHSFGIRYGEVKTWNLLDGHSMTLEGHRDRVGGVVVLADQRRVVSGGEDGNVKVWDLATGSCLEVMSGHKSFITCVAAAGGVVVSACFHRSIKFWNVEEGSCLQSLEGVFSIGEVAPGEPPVTGNGHEDGIWGVTVLPCGRVVTAARDGTMKVWASPQRDDERRLAVQVGRQRACADVVAVIKKFL